VYIVHWLISIKLIRLSVNVIKTFMIGPDIICVIIFHETAEFIP
jgi:hypothetical protein